MTVDEGAFQGADFFFRSIVPVALRDWSSVAIVTTPQGDSNYVSRLAATNNKDQNVIREDRNGRIRLEKQFADDIGLINVVHLGEPCEDCTSKGLADKCPHRELPPWKSRTRQTAYSEFLLKGREDDNLREQYAVIVKTTNNSFSELGIENLFTSTPHVTYNIPERIYIFVDPTGGGRSDFGITAGFWEKELVVLLQDSINLRDARGDAEERILLRAIEKIRGCNPAIYGNVDIVFAAEYAPARTPAALEHAVKTIPGVYTMREVKVDGQHHSGVPKTQENTRDMIKMTSTLLDSDMIRFSQDYMTVEDEAGRKCKIISMLMEQLQNFQWKADTSGDHGKFTGKVGGKNDDLAVSLFMLVYWSTMFKTRRTRGVLQKSISRKRVVASVPY